MKRKLTFLILLIFQVFLLQAQHLQEVRENVKLLSKDSLSAGFYLYQVQKDRRNTQFRGLVEVKKISPELSIVKIDSFLPDQKSFEGHFYTVGSSWKLSPGLRKKLPEKTAVYSVKTIDKRNFSQVPSVEVISSSGNYFIVEATPPGLLKLLENDRVMHVSLFKEPKVEAPVSFHDLAVNTINLVHDKYPGINGDRLKVSLKEQLFDTTDIDLKNRIFKTGEEPEEVDRHATLIATLIAGAGNSSDRSRGVARGAVISSASFLQIFPHAADFYRSNDIFVQNHSYGTAIEYEYGNEASAYDQIVNEIPQLVHVFSSGNAGTETSEIRRYAGIKGFANLTGNFKFAKNIITVGAVNNKKEVVEKSSKGPAPDGRIKPELVAYAPAGTSDAAALVSGTALLLQDFYLQKEGELPDAALVKALLIAAAEDVGIPGIDFSAGYGNLDAAGSMAILDAGNYLTSEVEPDSEEEIYIQIPEGTAQLKIALSWNDPAANPGDVVALVNDLNSSLIDSFGREWLPWVLRTEADIEKLLTPATRGRDSLNPVELITVENPVAGKYVLNISAKNAISAQAFSVAYVIIPQNHFQWTFPTSSNALLAGGENILRWKSSFSTSEAELQYRINGSEWRPLKAEIDLTSGEIVWLPRETGNAQLKMTIASETFESEIFAISPALSPQVVFNCEDELLLTWEKVEGATAYGLQQLGEFYMEEILTLQDTSALLQKENLTSKIMAVTPIFEGVKGLQGLAVNYEEQGVNCYYSGFFAHLEEDPAVNARLSLSTFMNIEKVIFQKENKGEKTVITEFLAPFADLNLEIRDLEVESGTNRYSAIIFLKDGSLIQTNVVDVFVPGRNTFVVYPNPLPAGEVLHILSRGDDLDFQIYDIRGQKLHDDQLLWFSDRVEFSPATRGLYLVRALRKGEMVGVKKVLVE